MVARETRQAREETFLARARGSNGLANGLVAPVLYRNDDE